MKRKLFKITRWLTKKFGFNKIDLMLIQVKLDRYKYIKSLLKLQLINLKIVLEINYPRDEEEKKMLEKVIKTYDECSLKLNGYVDRVREYVKEE